MFVILSAAAVIGLILVVLQKKGFTKPVVLQNMYQFSFISGGTITLFAVMMGAWLLCDYSEGGSGVYGRISGCIYFDSDRV